MCICSSTEYIPVCTNANPRQLGSFTSSCTSEEKSNWLKIYFYDTQCCQCIFTETTAQRRDDYRISPCQKHHWSIQLGDAIYTKQRLNQDTFLHHLHLQKDREITNVLHFTTLPGYVSEHRDFEMSVNSRCSHQKLSKWWVVHFPMS